MLLVQMKNRGVAAALNNLETDLGATDCKFPAVAGLVSGEQPHQAGIVGLAKRMQLSKIQLEVFLFRPWQHRFPHNYPTRTGCLTRPNGRR